MRMRGEGERVPRTLGLKLFFPTCGGDAGPLPLGEVTLKVVCVGEMPPPLLIGDMARRYSSSPSLRGR